MTRKRQNSVYLFRGNDRIFTELDKAERAATALADDSGKVVQIYEATFVKSIKPPERRRKRWLPDTEGATQPTTD